MNLFVPPTFLSGFMDHISRKISSQKEGGAGIVKLSISANQIAVRICVTIPAQMPAGIVSADVRSQNTGALPVPLVGFALGDIQSAMQGRLKSIYGHAAGAVGTVFFQFISFRAGTNGHSVFLPIRMNSLPNLSRSCGETPRTSGKFRCTFLYRSIKLMTHVWV